MATNLRQFDARPLVERIKAKHGWLRESDAVGVFSCFDSKAAIDTAGGNNDVIAVATTDAVDLEDEVVLPEGIDWSYVLDTKNTANRKMFVEHEMEVDKCVAFVRSIQPYRKSALNGWQVRFQWLRNSPFPWVAQCQSIAEQDGIGLSIGFLRSDAGRVTAEEAKRYPKARTAVRKCKAVEISLTCIPCEVNSQTLMGVQDMSKAAEIAERHPNAVKLFSIPRPKLKVGF